MTRYGLALVVTRSFAVGIWLIALMRFDYAIWAVVRLFTFDGVLESLIYLVIPTAIFMLGLVIWWSSESIAKRIAGLEPDAPVGGISADEAMLMRVVFSGIGIFLMTGFLLRVPLIVVAWMYSASHDAMEPQVFRPTLEYVIQTVAMFIFAMVLLIGSKPLTNLLIRLRKYD